MGWSPCCWSSQRSRSQAGHEVRSLPSRERADRVPLRAYPASAAATSATEEAAVRLQPSGTYRRRRIAFAPSWVPCRAWEGAFFFYLKRRPVTLRQRTILLPGSAQVKTTPRTRLVTPGTLGC